MLATDINKFFYHTQLPELCLKMILEYRTLLKLTRTDIRTAVNFQHDTFFKVSCWLQILKFFLNKQLPELCLKMILEYRIMLEVTRIAIKTAVKIQHDTYFKVSCWLQILNFFLNTQLPELCLK